MITASKTTVAAPTLASIDTDPVLRPSLGSHLGRPLWPSLSAVDTDPVLGPKKLSWLAPDSM